MFGVILTVVLGVISGMVLGCISAVITFVNGYNMDKEEYDDLS